MPEWTLLTVHQLLYACRFRRSRVGGKAAVVIVFQCAPVGSQYGTWCDVGASTQKQGRRGWGRSESQAEPRVREIPTHLNHYHDSRVTPSCQDYSSRCLDCHLGLFFPSVLASSRYTDYRDQTGLCGSSSRPRLSTDLPLQATMQDEVLASFSLAWSETHHRHDFSRMDAFHGD